MCFFCYKGCLTGGTFPDRILWQYDNLRKRLLYRDFSRNGVYIGILSIVVTELGSFSQHVRLTYMRRELIYSSFELHLM